MDDLKVFKIYRASNILTVKAQIFLKDYETYFFKDNTGRIVASVPVEGTMVLEKDSMIND